MLRTYRSLPIPFWHLWLGTLINRLGGFIVPFLAIYLTDERRMSIELTGLIVAMWGLGGLLGSPMGGWLADGWGRRRTMILSMLSGTVAVLGLGQAVAPWELGAGTLLLGLTTSLYRPAMGAAVADLVAPELRIRAYGFIYWASNLGFAGASVLGGLLAKAGFGLLFAVDAATMLAFGLIIWAKVPETQPVETQQGSVQGGRPYGDRLFMGLVGVTFLLATVFSQNISTLPVEMRQDGIDTALYGLLMAINGVMIVFLQPLAIQRVGRFLAGRVMALSALLMGVGFGLHYWADGPFGYAVAIAVWTLGEILFMPVGSKLVADLAPVERRGAYQGVYGTAWALSNVVAPALGGWLMAKHGSLGLWGACLAWGVLGAVGSLLMTRAFERRAAQRASIEACPSSP